MAENPYAAPAASLDRPDEIEGYGDLNFFTFRGRIGRLRYLSWAFGLYLLVSLSYIPIAGIGGVLGAWQFEGVAMVIAAIFMLAYIALFILAILWMIQRLHDFNASGWFALLIFVPFVPLIFLILPGTDGPNRFGKPPPPNSTGVKILAGIALLLLGLMIFAFIAVISGIGGVLG